MNDTQKGLDAKFNALLDKKSRDYAEGFKDALKFMIDMDDIYGDTIQLEAAVSEAMNRGIQKGLEIALSASSGVQLIAEERQRQIEVEGFNENHDAQYQARELLRAAHCYMIADLNYYKNSIVPTWPWPIKWWKPSPDNRIRELQKAGALIAAEIDRLQSIQQTTES